LAIPGLSFRSFAANLLPRRAGCKQALAVLLVLILSACGGSTKPQRVAGPGFSFSAPGGWKVSAKPRETSVAHGDVDLLTVTTFTLVRPYRAALWPKVVAELDRVAGDVARGLEGRIDARATTTVSGEEARRYDIAYGDLHERIAFVFRGKREYELLCRYRHDDSACGALFGTFRLA